MSRLNDILHAYHAGAISLLTAEFECASIIDEDNLERVMAALPPEILAGLRNSSQVDPELVLGDNLLKPHSEQILPKLRNASRLLREWFAKHQELQPDSLPAAPAAIPTSAR